MVGRITDGKIVELEGRVGGLDGTLAIMKHNGRLKAMQGGVTDPDEWLNISVEYKNSDKYINVEDYGTYKVRKVYDSDEVGNK